MRQAYSAATSYLDAQVGRVLDALRQNGFGGNTIISLLGDHGKHTTHLFTFINEDMLFYFLGRLLDQKLISTIISACEVNSRS